MNSDRFVYRGAAGTQQRNESTSDVAATAILPRSVRYYVRRGV